VTKCLDTNCGNVADVYRHADAYSWPRVRVRVRIRVRVRVRVRFRILARKTCVLTETTRLIDYFR